MTRDEVLTEIAKAKESCINDGISWLEVTQLGCEVTKRDEACIHYGFTLCVRLCQINNWLKGD